MKGSDGWLLHALNSKPPSFYTIHIQHFMSDSNSKNNNL